MSGLDRKEWHRMQRRLGRRVRVLRRARDLDQFALARLVGYRNANVICEIEKGTYNPPLYKLYALAAVLDTTPAALVGKTPLKRALQGAPPHDALRKATAALPPGMTSLIMALAIGLRKELLHLP